MNTGRKRVADLYFNRNSGKKKEETPYDENPNNTAAQARMKAENQKQQDLLDKQEKDAADEATRNQAEAQRNIDEQS
jgi:hypothetical protein